MDIPFESFASLVYRLGHPHRSKSLERSYEPAEVFSAWLNQWSKPLPAGTGKRLFRLLFPHEGARRRYGMKEWKLGLALERILGAKGLTKWDTPKAVDGSGCLGSEVEAALDHRASTSGSSRLSIKDVDDLLDQLACHSPFSQLENRPENPLPADDVLIRLFRNSELSPLALSVLTQVILADLRPLLNPLPSLRIRNPTSLLAVKTTAAPPQLDLLTALECWEERLPSIFKGGQGDLDRCLDLVESLSPDGGSETSFLPAGPVLGVNVHIPKCRKGRSVADALKEFCGNSRSPPADSVWAETKYDGYRMQIHVDVRGDEDVRVHIFSKSKRNSTVDRINTHSIILAALGLPVHPNLPQHPFLVKRIRSGALKLSLIRNVILEAEVVPYNEGQRGGGREPGIEEFWWLDVAGVTAEETDINDVPPNPDPHRHLCLIFFDILLNDGKGLLDTPYETRRQLLQSLVREIPGFAVVAQSQRISLHSGRASALQTLKEIFESSNHSREEGLVLKAGESTYLDPRWRWVKLKKDYIPGLGDCIDLVILGAGWDPDRARELRVDTTVLTTFYVGVISNRDRVKARLETPHFEILFRASYGLDRDALELVNGNIRHGRWASKSYDRADPFKRGLLGLSWTYRLPKGMHPPSLLFEHPLCAEIMGAGFLRLPRSTLYELRFPRIEKIFNPTDRPWTAALGSRELIEAAHKSLGYTLTSPHLTTSPQDDSMRNMWRTMSASGLVDVPDFPTPSPERPSPRRMRSAPAVTTIDKVSPPSPTSSRRIHFSPLASSLQTANRTPFLPSRPSVSSSQRLRDVQELHGTPNDHTLTTNLAVGQPSPELEERSWRIPVSRSQTRQKAGPSKRSASPVSPLFAKVPRLHTPPPTSPLRPSARSQPTGVSPREKRVPLTPPRTSPARPLAPITSYSPVKLQERERTAPETSARHKPKRKPRTLRARIREAVESRGSSVRI